MATSWREIARRTIERVAKEAIGEQPDINEADLRKRISEAYPFGPRQYHPYKMWLSEVKKYFATPLKTQKERIVAERIDDLPMFQSEE